MSRKNKRARGRRQEKIDHLGIARRELSKRNAKLALQHARLGHQQSPDADSREMLQRALLARAEQLYEHGGQDLAKGLIGELAALGAMVAELHQPLERLRVLLGLPRLDANAGETTDFPEPLAACLADEALLRPQRRCAAYAELNQQADLVREALRAIEAGDDAAVERLASIPRKSPFADWRLFARGLVGHYAGDADRTAANWDRLDPQRPAYRIANQLLVFSGHRRPEQCGFEVATGQKRLQLAVAGSPVIDHLESLRDQLQAGRVGDALRTLRTFVQRNSKTHAKLLERVTELLWRRFVRDGDGRWLSQLSKTVPAPPLDPRWNRAWAMIEEEQEYADLNRQETLWTAYVNDLQRCSILTEDERKIAASLVLLRLGLDLANYAASQEDGDSPDFLRDEYDDEENAEHLAAARRQAERYLRSAIGYYPLLLDAHRQLISLLLDVDRPEDAVTAARQLLEHFPDHIETLAWLGNYFIEADKPAEAEPYVDHVSRLRPRDPHTQSLIWHQRLGMLRHLVRKRKFDEARRQLQEAFANPPADSYPYWFDVLQATIEYKAKNLEAAERHLQAAQDQLQEPTVIWLMMHSCADRYGLDRKLKNEFRDRFQAAVKAGCHSQTAGHMARFLAGFLSRRVKYVGLATHQRLVLAYLNRARRVAWQNEDLRNVCRFLCLVDHWQGRPLRRRLIEEGHRRFPQEPLFLLLAALEEMEAGPFNANFARIERNLEQALQQNASAEHRLTEAEEERAKATLSAVRSTREMMSSFLGGMSEFMANAFGLDDDEWDEEEEDEEDEWDEDEEDDEEDGEDLRGAARGRTHSTTRRRSSSDERQRFFEF